MRILGLRFDRETKLQRNWVKMREKGFSGMAACAPQMLDICSTWSAIVGSMQQVMHRENVITARKNAE